MGDGPAPAPLPPALSPPATPSLAATASRPSRMLVEAAASAARHGGLGGPALGGGPWAADAASGSGLTAFQREVARAASWEELQVRGREGWEGGVVGWKAAALEALPPAALKAPPPLGRRRPPPSRAPTPKLPHPLTSRLFLEGLVGGGGVT